VPVTWGCQAKASAGRPGQWTKQLERPGGSIGEDTTMSSPALILAVAGGRVLAAPNARGRVEEDLGRVVGALGGGSRHVGAVGGGCGGGLRLDLGIRVW
jgi:hypothetical protein